MKLKINIIYPSKKIKTIEGNIGDSIMLIAQKNSIENIQGFCGGTLSCGTCHIYLSPLYYKLVYKLFPITDLEQEILVNLHNVSEFSRLSCQIYMEPLLDNI